MPHIEDQSLNTSHDRHKDISTNSIVNPMKELE